MDENKQLAFSTLLNAFEEASRGRPRDVSYYLDRLVTIAKFHGGCVISKSYQNAHTKLLFEDSSGKQFTASPHAVHHGKWSPHESRIRNPELHLRELRALAKSRGGNLAEGQLYKGAFVHLMFEDAEGNTFASMPTNIKKGHWSPYAAGRPDDPKWHLKKLSKLAKERGGYIVRGQTYKDRNSPLAFYDRSSSSTFFMTPANIVAGKWVSTNGNISEHICRQALEHLFLKPFPTRWDIVKRRNGEKLQLDGFCPELILAFEYQGYLHTSDPLQIERDQEKREYCANAGILLLEIPEFNQHHKLRPQLVIDHVTENLILLFDSVGRDLPTLNSEPFKIDYDHINRCTVQFKKLQDYVASHHPGGKVKEGQDYKYSITKMTFIDCDGYEFTRTPNEVISGKWTKIEFTYLEKIRQKAMRTGLTLAPNQRWGGLFTPLTFKTKMGEEIMLSPQQVKVRKNNSIINGVAKKDFLTYEKLSELVKVKNGSIVPSQLFHSPDEPLEFFDFKKRRFWMKPTEVEAGLWSPYEAIMPQKVTSENYLDRLQNIAVRRKGQLIPGQTYESSKKRIFFKDELGNVFSATPPSIIQGGSWSPYLSNNHTDGNERLGELNLIARSKGGSLIPGQTYVNRRTKLRFVDQNGREFTKCANLLKKGTWSPFDAASCKSKQTLFDEVQQIAQSRGGSVAPGQNYEGSKIKMQFVDSESNLFWMHPTNLKAGLWSPYQAKRAKCPEVHLSALATKAAQHHGKLVPGQIYKNSTSPLWFLDCSNRRFSATPLSIKRGVWKGAKP